MIVQTQKIQKRSKADFWVFRAIYWPSSFAIISQVFPTRRDNRKQLGHSPSVKPGSAQNISHSPGFTILFIVFCSHFGNITNLFFKRKALPKELVEWTKRIVFKSRFLQVMISVGMINPKLLFLVSKAEIRRHHDHTRSILSFPSSIIQYESK